MWRSTLFDICMCLYNAFTRCNNAIDRVRWRYNLEMRPCVISQALACVVYSSTSIVYNYTQLFTLIYLPIYPPINEFPREVFPHFPRNDYPNYFKPYSKYCCYHVYTYSLLTHSYKTFSLSPIRNVRRWIYYYILCLVSLFISI